MSPISISAFRFLLTSLFLTSAAPTELGGSVIVDEHQNVERFYGIPVDLSLSDLKKLGYKANLGHRSSEGERYNTAVIEAADGVRVEISFDQEGKLWELETASTNAIVPGELRVGSRLSDVRAAWPQGKLTWYVEEHRPYVTFITGTNLAFSFNSRDMPPRALDLGLRGRRIPDLKVQSIIVASKPLRGPEVCHPDFCQ